MEKLNRLILTLEKGVEILENIRSNESEIKSINESLKGQAVHFASLKESMLKKIERLKEKNFELQRVYDTLDFHN